MKKAKKQLQHQSHMHYIATLVESTATTGAMVIAANQKVANAKRIVSYSPNIAIISRKICSVNCAQQNMNNTYLH